MDVCLFSKAINCKIWIIFGKEIKKQLLKNLNSYRLGIVKNGWWKCEELIQGACTFVLPAEKMLQVIVSHLLYYYCVLPLSNMIHAT